MKGNVLHFTIFVSYNPDDSLIMKENLSWIHMYMGNEAFALSYEPKREMYGR